MSVEFEPTRLGPDRRRIDPIALGVFTIVFALLLAVVKPWGGEPPAAAEASGRAAESAPSSREPSAAPQSVTAIPVPRIVQARSSAVADDAAILKAIRRHEAWGIRVVMLAPGSDGPAKRLVERWFRLPAGGIRPAEAAIDVGDVEIVAMGVTFPPPQMPLDVRVWRMDADGAEWVDTQAVDSVPSGGAFVYTRPGAPGKPPLTGRQRQAWAPGTYRLDVLVDGGIRTVGARIFSTGSEAEATPTPEPLAEDLVPPGLSTLPDLTIGAFATVDGVGVPLESVEGPALNEVGAWLDLDPGTGRAPRSFVATAYLPWATGLGVMLPPGSVVRAAGLDRLAPEPLPVVAPRAEQLAAGDDRSPEHVLFAAPDGGLWSPGVYRISVEWADGDGIHDRSWHLELRPGPVREPPRMLAAARAWARYAGESGVILGTVEPLVGGPRSAVIRMIPLRPEAPYPAESGVGCGGSAIAGRPQVLGFAHPVDIAVNHVEARIRRPYLRRGPVVLDAAFGIPGLVLAAPARAPYIGDANYEFVVGAGPEAQTYFLCHGMSTFDDSPPR